jgi:hypothetical protein
VNRAFHFHKRSQYFNGAHNETISVAIRVNNTDPSAVAING